MIIRSCANSISKACPCDDPPIANFSSEAPDTLDFLDREWAGNDPPPFFQQWNTIECGQTFVSNISQADAELQALAIVAACADQGPCIGCPPGVGGGPGRGLPLICNQTQQSCVPCPDGTQFCYVIPAGSFCGFTNQARANSYAHGLAFSLARQKRFCLSNISSNACTGTAYNQTIVVTGAVVTPCTWTVVAGAMPPGLTFGGFSPNIDTTLGPSETIQGTPTLGGTFQFTVQCQGSDFSFMQKTYTICVGNIQPTSFPSGTVGIAYSQSLTENSGCLPTPLAWTLASGSLPPGLVFASSGTINGTPTTAGDYTFTVKKTSGSNSCSHTYTIHIVSGACVCPANATINFPGGFDAAFNQAGPCQFTAPGSGYGGALNGLDCNTNNTVGGVAFPGGAGITLTCTIPNPCHAPWQLQFSNASGDVWTGVNNTNCILGVYNKVSGCNGIASLTIS